MRLVKYFWILFLCQLAQANNTFSLFEPEYGTIENDFLISRIFVPIFGYGQGLDYLNAFSMFSAVFLKGLLVISCVLLAYSVVVNTANTANGGKFLGGRTSGFFLSARFAFGTGMMLPLGASGFSAIQYVVMWGAVNGVLFANVIWEEFAKNPFAGHISLHADIKRSIASALKSSTMAHLCTKGMTEYIQGNWGLNKIAPENYSSNVGATGLYDGVSVYYKEPTKYEFGVVGNPRHRMSCGNLKVDFDAYVFEKQNSTFRSQIGKAAREGIRKKHIVEIENIINTKSKIIADELYPEIKAWQQDKINYNADALKVKALTKFQNTIDTYANDINTTLQGFISNGLNNNLAQEMVNEGFASAGAFFFRLSLEFDSVEQALNYPPPVVDSGKAGSLGWLQDCPKGLNNKAFCYVGYYAEQQDIQAIDYLNKIDEVVDYAYGKLNLSPSAEYRVNNNLKEELRLNEDAEPSEVADKINVIFNTSELDSKFVDRIKSKSDMSRGIDSWNDGHSNALVEIHALGKAITFWTQTIFAGMLVLVLVAPTTIVSVLQPVVMIMLGMFLVPGLLLAFYVPLIPFILWMGALFGWLVLVVEALFGAPMWLVTFMSPDADNFVGRHGQGYSLSLSLFLRPALMMLGLIAATVLITPVVDMVHYFFARAYDSISQATNGWLMVMFWLAMFVIYCIIINKLVYQIFSLIFQVPDSLLQWIGGGGPQLGQTAKGVEGAITTASAATLMASNQLANGSMQAFENLQRANANANANKEKTEDLKNHGNDRIINDLMSQTGGKPFTDLMRQASNSGNASSFLNSQEGKTAQKAEHIAERTADALSQYAKAKNRVESGLGNKTEAAQKLDKARENLSDVIQDMNNLNQELGIPSEKPLSLQDAESVLGKDGQINVGNMTRFQENLTQIKAKSRDLASDRVRDLRSNGGINDDDVIIKNTPSDDLMKPSANKDKILSDDFASNDLMKSSTNKAKVSNSNLGTENSRSTELERDREILVNENADSDDQKTKLV